MSLVHWLTWLAIALALGVNALAYQTYQATRRDLAAVRAQTYGIALERDLALAHRCSCYIPGATCGDPPGLSKRQAAEFALRVWQAQQEEGHG